MLGMWLAIALADPGAFSRTRDTLSVRRYHTISGEPARARWANAGGPYEAWAFRDGVVERYRRYAGRTLVEERTFDTYGGPFVTLTWADGALTAGAANGVVERTVSLAGWERRAVGPLTVLAPPDATMSPGRLSVRRPDLQLDLQWVDGPADVFSDRFSDTLSLRCACTVIDRATGFIADRAGARFLVLTPGPDGQRLGERWAVPGPNGKVLLASYDVPLTLDGAPVAADRYPAALATGRVALATARW
jgi:hypothetical protein